MSFIMPPSLLTNPFSLNMLLDMPSETHQQLLPHIFFNGLAAPAPHLKTFSRHLLDVGIPSKVETCHNNKHLPSCINHNLPLPVDAVFAFYPSARLLLSPLMLLLFIITLPIRSAATLTSDAFQLRLLFFRLHIWLLRFASCSAAASLTAPSALVAAALDGVFCCCWIFSYCLDNCSLNCCCFYSYCFCFDFYFVVVIYFAAILPAATSASTAASAVALTSATALIVSFLSVVAS